MEINTRFDQPWLEPFLKADFKHSWCDQHAEPYNIFCIDCMRSFCKKCDKQENLHEGHQTLTKYAASRSIAARHDDIQGLLDTSNIHRFIMNSHYVLFLNSRQQKSGWSKGSNQCVTCHWPLEDAKNLYCSIGCKVLMWKKNEEKRKGKTIASESFYQREPERYKAGGKEGRSRRVPPQHKRFKTDFTASSSRLVGCSKQAQNSHRKRSRKGIPIRSPLY